LSSILTRQYYKTKEEKLKYMFGKTQIYTLIITSLIILSLIMTSFVSCNNRQKESVSLTAFVGAASKPAMDEAVKIFEAKTGIKVQCIYGGSGTILAQMELAKFGDLYMPASPDYISQAEEHGIIDINTVKIISYLIPVIAVQKGNPKNIKSLSDLAQPRIKVGIGNPEAVCVGLYSIELLDYNGLLVDVSKNIITQAENGEKTATLLSLKAVDAVIGWHVFHDWDPDNIDVVYLEPEQVPRIAFFPAVISTFCHDLQNTQRFIDFLVSKEGQDIFSKWGYITTESEVKKFAPNAAIGGECQLPEIYRALFK
jgi:molybdate transport system substrate-binding protein